MIVANAHSINWLANHSFDRPNRQSQPETDRKPFSKAWESTYSWNMCSMKPKSAVHAQLNQSLIMRQELDQKDVERFCILLGDDTP
mmetsp:Transcript_9446/g.19643  ORF Transcript_9446/g.19643 Transcript_9446/m.19643 type:complete len:86 (+) Transcript_9446:803-1060(+)